MLVGLCHSWVEVKLNLYIKCPFGVTVALVVNGEWSLHIECAERNLGNKRAIS